MREFEQALRDRLGGLGIQRARLTVAVSGGADSVALLRGLLAVSGELALEVIVGHVDHGLRSTSAEDADWIAAECSKLDVPIEVRRADVPARAAETGSGIEETARRMRYDSLTRIAIAHSSRFVVVGHTADDQAETILHHVLRGTGLDGLRGMRAERMLGPEVRMIRPMLELRRDEARAYLNEIGQGFLEDVTNADPSYTRNRIRGSLLPMLRAEFNPRVAEALLRLGAQAGEVQDVLELLSGRLLSDCLLESGPDHVRVNCERLPAQPRHLVREMFKELWNRQQWPRGSMTFAHWDKLAQMSGELSAECPPRMSLPGQFDVHRRGGLLMICCNDQDRPNAP